MQVTDLILETEKRITKLELKSSAQAKRLESKIVSFSIQVQNLKKPLRTFLMENLYNHYRVIRMSNKAKRFIQELFKIYINNPKQLPPHIQKNIPQDGTRRVVCDYIAGMTDRYALDEYKKLFDPYEKV
jgi:dGTPase